MIAGALGGVSKRVPSRAEGSYGLDRRFGGKAAAPGSGHHRDLIGRAIGCTDGHIHRHAGQTCVACVQEEQGGVYVGGPSVIGYGQIDDVGREIGIVDRYLVVSTFGRTARTHVGRPEIERRASGMDAHIVNVPTCTTRAAATGLVVEHDINRLALPAREIQSVSLPGMLVRTDAIEHIVIDRDIARIQSIAIPPVPPL